MVDMATTPIKTRSHLEMGYMHPPWSKNGSENGGQVIMAMDIEVAINMDHGSLGYNFL